MAKLQLYVPNPEIIAYVAAHMRKADRDEVKAASGRPPLDVLLEGVDISDECYAMGVQGRPAAIFGVVPVDIGGWAGAGAIWLLGTDDLKKHRLHFMRGCLPILNELNRRWGILTNLVDARNLLHIRWLTAMGFRLGAPVIAGVEQRPFVPFTRTLEV